MPYENQKKMISAVIALLLAASSLPLAANAAQTDNAPDTPIIAAAESIITHTDDTTPIIECGECGDNVKFEIHESGILYIYGEGAMKDYVFSDIGTQFENIEKITTAIIENGVAKIGDHSFYYFKNLNYKKRKIFKHFEPLV